MEMADLEKSRLADISLFEVFLVFIGVLNKTKSCVKRGRIEDVVFIH
jgi:hypothetical protein